VSGTELEHRSKQQTDAVKAAKEAGVKHILYTSAKRRPDVSNSPIQLVLNSHIDTENAIKESGMAYTLLRSNLYMDLLRSFLGEKVLENGIFFPAGDGKVGFTLRADMAEAAANVLMGDGHEYKTYNISNPLSVSFGEIAKLLSEISGKVINHHNSDSKAYIDTLTGAGVPQAYALMLAGFAEAAKQGEFVSGETDLRKMLGREPFAVKQFLGDLYSKLIQS
jgi:NAD(P)H dehydrogenase (quinone)